MVEDFSFLKTEAPEQMEQMVLALAAVVVVVHLGASLMTAYLDFLQILMELALVVAVAEKEARVGAMVLEGQAGEVLLHYISTTMEQMGLSKIAAFLQAVAA